MFDRWGRIDAEIKITLSFTVASARRGALTKRVLSFVLAGHLPLEVGEVLNAEGIAVRAGHHCAQPALRRLGLESTVRPSFSFYNTHEEIDVFLHAERRMADGVAGAGCRLV